MMKRWYVESIDIDDDDDNVDDDDSDNNLHVDWHIVDGLPNERISD
jgi:hypothetical protein